MSFDCSAQDYYSKTFVKPPLSKRPKTGFQDQVLLNAGQKYCRMLQGEHSATLLTFIKLSFVIKVTKSAIMNIFRKKYFLFKSFVKIELSYAVTINLFTKAENCMGK